MMLVTFRKSGEAGGRRKGVEMGVFLPGGRKEGGE